MRSSLPQLYCFIRALSHKIRTPLSVIQNELTYFKSKLAEEEFDRAFSACKNINELLKKASSAVKLEPDFRKISLQEFSGHIASAACLQLKNNLNDSNLVVELDSELFTLAWESIVSFFVNSCSAKLITAELRKKEDILQLNLNVPYRFLEASVEDSSQNSFSEFSLYGLKKDSLFLPLADIVLAQHNWVVAILAGKESIEVFIDIPAISKP